MIFPCDLALKTAAKASPAGSIGQTLSGLDPPSEQ
jgi:hypothetical protein